MAVTITHPPCSGGTVRTTHTYAGTYDLARFRPRIEPPFDKVAFEIKATLTIGDKDSDHTSTTLGPFTATWTASDESGKGTWSYQFNPAPPPGRSAKVTATLLVAGVPSPVSVSDFIVRVGGSIPSCLDNGDLVAEKGGAKDAAHGAANGIAEGVRGAAGGVPPGYILGVFSGTYDAVPTVPLAVVHCRIEKRPLAGNLKRVTLTTARAVVFFGGVWTAYILVPTVRDTEYRYRFIAEFFDANGVLLHSADDRKLD